MYEQDFVDTHDTVLAEVTMWQRKLKGSEELQDLTALELLKKCNKTFFPNVFTLLKILCTLPVTTCEGERSFSTLAKLKSYERSVCGQDRINGLALLNIYREITPPTEVIAEHFVSKKKRRIVAQ